MTSSSLRHKSIPTVNITFLLKVVINYTSELSPEWAVGHWCGWSDPSRPVALCLVHRRGMPERMHWGPALQHVDESRHPWTERYCWSGIASSPLYCLGTQNDPDNMKYPAYRFHLQMPKNLITKKQHYFTTRYLKNN